MPVARARLTKNREVTSKFMVTLIQANESLFVI
jgi:hypothetical protein